MELIEYELLMSTAESYYGSKLHGAVTKTYCEHCNKFLRIYSIRLDDDDISKEKAVNILKNSIENREKYFFENIDKRYFIDEDKYFFYIKDVNNIYKIFFAKEDYDSLDDAKKDVNAEINELIKLNTRDLLDSLNSLYFIEFQDIHDYYFKDNHEDTIICPECNKEVLRGNFKSYCPKCGGNSSIMGFVHVD